MPTWNDRDREVETDHRVHGHDQRGCQAREKQVSLFVTVPVPCRAAPSHGKDAVDDLACPALRPVAQRRQIWNEPHEPEHQRNGSVSRNSEHVPHERAAELRPDLHRVGIGDQPVGQPGPTHVN